MLAIFRFFAIILQVKNNHSNITLYHMRLNCSSGNSVAFLIVVY